MTGSTSSTSGRPATPRRDLAGRALLTLALLLAAWPAGAADDLDALMAVLASTTHGRASYVETQYLKILDRPLQSSGELLYEKPDRLEKRTLKPRAASLLAQGDALTLESGGRRHTAQLSEVPQAAPFIEGIRATLGGDRAALERHFEVSMSGTVGGWRLLLRPREASGAAVRDIEIQGAQGQLARIDIHQRDGDHSEMLIGPPAP